MLSRYNVRCTQRCCGNIKNSPIDFDGLHDENSNQLGFILFRPNRELFFYCPEIKTIFYIHLASCFLSCMNMMLYILYFHTVK